MDQKDEHSNSPFELILSRLDDVKRSGNQYKAPCPAHDDKKASLTIKEANDGRVLLKCFAGCRVEDIVSAVSLSTADLFPKRKGGRGYACGKPNATVQGSRKKFQNIQDSDCANVNQNQTVACNNQLQGVTLEQYAEAKRLPLDYLRSLGLSTITYLGAKAVRIPYFNKDGTEAAIRFRTALDKSPDVDNRFRWKAGSKPNLYGLQRVFTMYGYLVLVEGESDVHTLWFHDIPAYGIPGAGNWNEERDAPYLDGITLIYVMIEPDAGGDAVQKWLASSRIRDRVKLVGLGEYKDPSDLYLADPDHFKENFDQALSNAVPWSEQERVREDAEREKAWTICHDLAKSPAILDKFIKVLRGCGLAGEERAAKILFLAIISSFLRRLISVVIKGPSSGGKSYLVEIVLKFFPPSVFYELTAMSEHSLAYSEESFKNRFLIVYEAAGISGSFVNYLIRSLLSEGYIRYDSVEKTANGMKPKSLRKEGPTGFITTTTAVGLHPENETRLLSITVDDSPKQTAAIMEELAEKAEESKETYNGIDLAEWHALQEWLSHSEHQVIIPFAKQLARLIPPVAVRLRRDFTMLLNFIRCHAILHQATREKDPAGRIIASIEDYEVVKKLTGDLFAQGVDATVPKTIRETIEAVEKIIRDGKQCATVKGIATVLNLDTSSASRRVKAAIKKGYLINNEHQKGKPAQIAVGDPLPDDIEILPSPEKLKCCGVAEEMGGITIHTPPATDGFVPTEGINLLEGQI